MVAAPVSCQKFFENLKGASTTKMSSPKYFWTTSLPIDRQTKRKTTVSGPSLLIKATARVQFRQFKWPLWCDTGELTLHIPEPAQFFLGEPNMISDTKIFCVSG